MARKTMWAVAGAVLAFAPLASAATYNLELEGARTYASEVISSGDVEIDYRTSQMRPGPRLDITLFLDGTEAVEIDDEDTIAVTITLSNAKFGRNIRAGDLAPEVFRMTSGCDARVRDLDDGERGQNTVTFVIEATGGDCVCTGTCLSTAPPYVEFNFSLPRLYGLHAARPVSASVTTDTPGGSGWPDTEAMGAGVGGRACDNMANAATECVQLQNGVLRRLAVPTGMPARRSPATIINYAEGLTFVGTSMSGTTRIDLAAGRRTFTEDDRFQAHLGGVRLGVASAAACNGDDPAPAGCTLQLNGRPFSIGRNGDGSGDLVVDVSGDFRRGDIVYVDFDGDSAPDTGERLSLVDGAMQGAFSLTDVAGDATAGEGDANEMAREEGVPAQARQLLYRPNGTHPLRPGDYRTSWAVEFSKTTVSDKSAEPTPSDDNTHMTQYSVVEDDQVAYAIPPGTTGDVGHVRIKCDVATECTVYLECDHADGRTWFEQVADPIPGRSTLVLTSESMRTTLGLEDDEWTRGRLSCTVYSTREISLQVLTRSDSGVLVNNTYVDAD